MALTGTDPLVWRRMQVPEGYSFWDLHVAIQDAMGWKDYHLHEFRLFDEAAHTLVSIGIPTGEAAEDRPVIAGWDVPVSRFFDQRGWHEPPATCAHDFGDDWQHIVVHEGLEPSDDSLTYPRCVAGEGRCSPEDCGGAHGYAEFLAAIADPNHEEHEQLLTWAGGGIRSGGVRFRGCDAFDDPQRRWPDAFGRSVRRGAISLGSVLSVPSAARGAAFHQSARSCRDHQLTTHHWPAVRCAA